MRKILLRPDEPSEEVCVEQAGAWARALTRSEVRGPGDMTNAWRRLERRYGIASQVFWSLRYRRPSQIAASIWLRLGQAYEAECQRQMHRLQHEIDITRQIAGARHPDVLAAQTVVDAAKGGPELPKDVA